MLRVLHNLNVLYDRFNSGTSTETANLSSFRSLYPKPEPTESSVHSVSRLSTNNSFTPSSLSMKFLITSLFAGRVI